MINSTNQRKNVLYSTSFILLILKLSLINAFLTTRQIPTTFKTVSTTQNNIQKNYFSLSSTTNPEETKRLPLCKGSYVAIVTPFTPTGSVDLDAMRKLLKYHLDGGTDGICVLGTTGESATLSMSEREAVLKVTVEEVKGKIPILVGTGTINPEDVKIQTIQAMDLGADAAMVVTPYYVKPPQRGLVKFFNTIADLGMPIVLYNVPGRTACDLVPETIAICAQHENIIGVKEATGDLDRVSKIRSLCGDDLLLFSGDDSTETEFVLLGGDGCISVTANVAPSAMHEMITSALNGNADVARTQNEKLKLLHKNLFIEPSPMPVKWALQRLGLINPDFCRLPLDVLDEKYYPDIENALSAAELI